MELKSDLSHLKVGDKVFCTIYGWGKIKEIDYLCDFPIKVLFKNDDQESYKIDGKLYACSLYPSLFTYNPFEKKEFEPRWMMVSDDKISWRRRYVIGKEIKYLAYSDAETNEVVEELENSDDIDIWEYATWEYAKEIEEVEFSMEEAIEELAKLKGVDKSLIKIKL